MMCIDAVCEPHSTLWRGGRLSPLRSGARSNTASPKHFPVERTTPYPCCRVHSSNSVSSSPERNFWYKPSSSGRSLLLSRCNVLARRNRCRRRCAFILSSIWRFFFARLLHRFRRAFLRDPFPSGTLLCSGTPQSNQARCRHCSFDAARSVSVVGVSIV